MDCPFKIRQKDSCSNQRIQANGCGNEEKECNDPYEIGGPLTLSNSQSGVGFPILQLPDEILVKVGIYVAKICGTRDYVLLSQTSKRIRRLLMHQETISSVLQAVSSQIHRNRLSMLLPSRTSKPIVITTLEQLAFFESVREQGFLQENRFNPQLGSKVRKILSRHPSVILILDAHSGRGELMASTPYGHFDYRAKHAYERIVANSSPGDGGSSSNEISSTRIRIRVWGRAVAEKASESEHPYSTKARKGKGWVEIFFQMPGCEEDVLELPPRPGFYSGLAVPQFQFYESFVYFDDSDTSSGED